MHPIRRSIIRSVRALAGASLLALFAAGTALGHSQAVDPNGNGDGFTKPISNAWAQAHCHAASPAVVSEASNGVVQFLPAGALPCPPVPNPGGQIHGD